MKLEAEDHEAFLTIFSLARFRERYGTERLGQGNAFEHAPELEAKASEWQRRLLLPANGLSVSLLCCPEDVERGRRCKHREEEL